MSNLKEKISVVLPVYNEQDALAKVVDAVGDVLYKGGYNFEIIVVDDASTDNSVDTITEKNVRLIRHKIHRGSGAARKTGILNAGGDIIVMLDADGSYPAESIPEILKFIPEYDLVVGSRSKEYGPFKALRIAAKWMLCKLACFLTRTEIEDLNSGMRAFRKEVMLRYLYLLLDGFSCTSTITLAFICNGYAVKYVAIDYRMRIGKSKFHSVKDTGNYLLTIIRMIMHFNPLRIFIPLSLIVFLIGVIKTVYDVYWGIHDMQESDIILLIIAVLIFIAGLLADLIIVHGRR